SSSSAAGSRRAGTARRKTPPAHRLAGPTGARGARGGEDERVTAAGWTPPMPELEGANHRRLETGEVALHVAELGPADAPPLLLVHGWPQNWWCWHRVAPLLATEYRLLMPDLRGHGWSDAVAGYEKERLAAD